MVSVQRQVLALLPSQASRSCLGRRPALVREKRDKIEADSRGCLDCSGVQILPTSFYPFFQFSNLARDVQVFAMLIFAKPFFCAMHLIHRCGLQYRCFQAAGGFSAATELETSRIRKVEEWGCKKNNEIVIIY